MISYKAFSKVIATGLWALCVLATLASTFYYLCVRFDKYSEYLRQNCSEFFLVVIGFSYVLSMAALAFLMLWELSHTKSPHGLEKLIDIEYWMWVPGISWIVYGLGFIVINLAFIIVLGVLGLILKGAYLIIVA